MGKEEPHVLDIVGPEELSTSDRMFLTLGAFKKTIFWAKMGLVGLIVIMIWSVGTDNYGVVEFIEEIYWWWTVLPLTVLVVVMLVWLVVSGGKLSGTSDILRRQHRMETYFATLSLATRETDDLSLDFFNIAVDVFPELKQHESEINQESGEVELEGVILEKKNNYEFDAWEKTKEGTFLIKSFPHNAPKMKVTYEQIEKAAKLAKEELGEGCLRLVCLADAFESKAVEEIAKIEGKMEDKVPIDLILGNSIGFSAVRISPLNP